MPHERIRAAAWGVANALFCFHRKVGLRYKREPKRMARLKENHKIIIIAIQNQLSHFHFGLLYPKNWKNYQSSMIDL